MIYLEHSWQLKRIVETYFCRWILLHNLFLIYIRLTINREYSNLKNNNVDDCNKISRMQLSACDKNEDWWNWSTNLCRYLKIIEKILLISSDFFQCAICGLIFYLFLFHFLAPLLLSFSSALMSILGSIISSYADGHLSMLILLV